jgi:hypothetical protein
VKRKVFESNLESDEDRHVKKSKENAIPANGVVVAPLTITFASPDKTALIWREDPVEFDHALAYISFVKSHFASSPEVYQQFISILYSAKDQEDQDCLSAIVNKVALLFDNQAALLEGFVYFLPQQLLSWAKAKIEVMTQMNNIPEYAPTSEEAGNNLDGGIVLFPTDNDDIGQAVPTPDIDTPINEDAPFSYPYAIGVDYTDENIKRHVDVFYKLVLPIFYSQGCTAKLIDKEKYKEIKTALLHRHHGELFATLKKEGYLVIHYWKKIYALAITSDDDDDSNVLLVARPTGLSADRTVCDVEDALRITFLNSSLLICLVHTSLITAKAGRCGSVYPISTITFHIHYVRSSLMFAHAALNNSTVILLWLVCIPLSHMAWAFVGKSI